MSFRKVFLFLALSLFAGMLSAQTATEQKAATTTAAAAQVPEGGAPRYIKPETAEQRSARLAVEGGEDPGPNPDPDKVWVRKGGRKFKIARYDRRWAKYDAPVGYVRPLGLVNFFDEIYQENDKYVWVWHEEIAAPTAQEIQQAQTSGQYQALTPEGIKYLETIRDDYAPLDPPSANVTIRFRESSTGLPTGGSWRNTLAVADMNEDGFVDLITTAQRSPGSNTPSIFLGDGKGGWSVWKDYRWPSPINYGSVVAHDFNKDKHMDLAFGLHLSGAAVYYGNGKGQFREAQGLPRDFASRRVVLSDVDRDGWMDFVAISEGPMGRGERSRNKYANLRAYLSRNKGESWEGVNLSPDRTLISGDWLSTGDFNGDNYPDFVGSCIYFDCTQTVILSDGKKGYSAFDGKGTVIPFRSYYHASTAGKFTSSKRDDAVVASFRVWPDKIDPTIATDPPLKEVVSIDRIDFSGAEAKRQSIMRWKADQSVWGLANGDFNGDGKLDLVFTRQTPREAVVLLGDGKGDFTRAKVEGIELPPLRNYDLKVADVNRDSRPDLIIMYESESSPGLMRKNGRIQVFLNEGAGPSGK